MIGTIISGVAALGSAIYGAVKSGKENKKARQLIAQERADNREWYNTEMNKDYTSRSDAQALLTKQRELLEERAKSARGAAVVAGASEASVAAEKEAANTAMAETMADIASGASAHKDEVTAQYREEDSRLNQQQAEIHQQQANNVAQAAGQLTSTATNLLGQSITGADIIKKPETPTPSGKNLLSADITKSNIIDGMAKMAEPLTQDFISEAKKLKQIK